MISSQFDVAVVVVGKSAAAEELLLDNLWSSLLATSLGHMTQLKGRKKRSSLTACSLLWARRRDGEVKLRV